MIIKVIILAVLLIPVPLLIGTLWTGAAVPRDGSLIRAYLFGLFTMLALFQLLAVPMCFGRMSLKLLARIYTVCLLCLSAAALVRGKSFPAQRKWLAACLRTFTPVMAAACACMLLQAAYITDRQHVDEDDAFYLAAANAAVETDILYGTSAYTGRVYTHIHNNERRYLLASWPIFLAYLSSVSHMHVTVLAHMLIPAFVLMWTYMVMTLYAGLLFPKDRHRQGVFLLMVTCLFLFSGYSIYNAAEFVLVRSWQGKAVLAGMGLPFLLYVAMPAVKEDRWTLQWSLLAVVIAGLASLTTIGSVFGCVLAGSVALPELFRRKDPRLVRNLLAACLMALLCIGAYLLRRWV